MEIEKHPNLNENEKEHVLVTHDESIFRAADDNSYGWYETGKNPIKRKGQGKSIMVSTFLCECHGILKLSADMEAIEGGIIDVTEMIEPGGDTWWTSTDLIKQMEKALKIFERLHPNKIGVFQFDCSSNHQAYANDALRKESMNLNPGGAQKKLRDSVFGPNNTPQKFQYPADCPILLEKKNKDGSISFSPLAGEPKGMKQILLERGLWKNSLKKTCKLCKSDNPDVDDRFNMNRKDCCVDRIIELQPDFQAQVSVLEELVIKKGHQCIFLPKYHCELNFIEMFWGATKRFVRDNCNYNFDTLRKNVPLGLNSVPLDTIRRFARKSWRYMDIYSSGETGIIAEYICRKFSSHRYIPNDQIALLREEYHKMKK